MSNNENKPKTLLEAIERIENLGLNKAQDLKQILEKDYNEIRKNLDGLKPHLEDLKSNVENEVKKTKMSVEEKVQNNPWATLAVVGLVAFVLGWLFGRTKDE